MGAISRIKRIKDVLVVFLKYGLASFFPAVLIRKADVESVKSKENIEQFSTPERFRMAFEELGTTFIKLGQMLSLRGDLIPEEYALEFKKLQSSVEPVSFDKIKPLIEEELGQTIEEVFSFFNETPLASASISQVYEATLREDERAVVVKVRKPGVVKTIQSDMELLFTLANLLNRYSPLRKRVDFHDVVEEFFITTKNELDLLIEMRNTNKFRKNFADDEWNWLHFPEMMTPYCSAGLLVMERIYGVSLYDVDRLDAERFDRDLAADRGAQVLMKMILQDGFFHADLHAGNFFFHEDTRLTAIDCGMVGEVDQYMKEQLANFFIAFASRDYRSLAKIYLNISDSSHATVDRKSLARDIQKVMSKVPDNLSGLNMKQVGMETMKIFYKHQLYVPAELTLILRAMGSVEGLGRDLSPEFQIFTASKELSEKLLAEKFSPQNISRDLVVLLSRISEFATTAPENISDILEKVEAGNLHHPIRFSFDSYTRKTVSRFVSRVSGSLLLTAALISIGIVDLSEPRRLYVLGAGALLGFGMLLLSFREK